MIDRVKLLIEERVYLRTIQKAHPESIIHKGNSYAVYNAAKTHFLRLSKCHNGFILDGSWRKWYWGRNSLKDLTRSQIFEVAKSIANLLNIPVIQLLSSKVLIIEFGRTFQVPFIPESLIAGMRKYGRTRIGRYDTSIKFQGIGYSLKAYDKFLEIAAKKPKGYGLPNFEYRNSLRLEIDGASRKGIKLKLRGIETINDVINQYRNLIITLYHEIKKIEIQHEKMMADDFKGKTSIELTQYLLSCGIKYLGAERVFKSIAQLDISSSNKTQQRNKLRKIIASFQTGTFDIGEFHKTCRLQLAKCLPEPAPIIV